MTGEGVRALLEEVASGRLAPADAERRLRWSPVEDLGFARIDHHRELRHGFPEVVFGEGKTVEQIVAISQRIAARGGGLLVTRACAAAGSALTGSIPGLSYDPVGRTAYLAGAEPPPAVRGPILIVTAGTGDLPVAEEAAVTARAFGNPVERLMDVGVAGLHRLVGAHEQLDRAAVVVVVAGMEGALPSVLGGLVGVPVIAVPTSIGYGASFGGVAALLGMLNSCAAGVTVVNIDNGFGAACAAARINRLSTP
jgi:pyridinium-3,5-biscarboxylic acid mononucleotide synthase